MPDFPTETLHKTTLRSNGKGSYLTPAGVAVFNALHEAGMHYADIAKVVGITKAGAYNRIQADAPARNYDPTPKTILGKIQSSCKTSGGYLSNVGNELFRSMLKLPDIRNKDLAIIFGMTPSAVSHQKAEINRLASAFKITKPRDHNPRPDY